MNAMQSPWLHDPQEMFSFKADVTTQNISGQIDSVFMLRGRQNTVLPFRQSVHLCDALAGDPDKGAAVKAVVTESVDPLKRNTNGDVAVDSTGSAQSVTTGGKVCWLVLRFVVL